MVDFVRHRMSLDLAQFSPGQYDLGELWIEPMTGYRAADLAWLSLECYRGTPDWDLDPDLQTFEGCKKFISALLGGDEVFGGRQGAFRGDLSFVLLHGSELCGANYALFGKEIAFIIDFALAPSVRGRGIGRMFLDYALQRYKEAGYSTAMLLVTGANEPAVRLYKSLGFKVDDTHTVSVMISDK